MRRMKYPKFPYWRSQTHLRNVADLPCQLCGIHGLTQASHSNSSIHGKGRGIKASDQYTAALCVSCHSMIDQGSHLARDDRAQLWLSAFGRTVRELLRREMWPSKIAVPNAGN